MGVWRTAAYFVLGLLFVLFAFPVAFYVSAALGYLLLFVAIALGVYMVARREGRLQLVLGIVLLIFAIPVLFVTAAVHIGAWALAEAFKEVAAVKDVAGDVGEAVNAGEWEITVFRVNEAKSVEIDNRHYKTDEGYKLVLVRLRAKNVGDRARSPMFTILLITDTGKSYERVSLFDLKIAEDAPDAPVVEIFDMFKTVAPGASLEGDLLFKVPAGDRLYIELWNYRVNTQIS